MRCCGGRKARHENVAPQLCDIAFYALCSSAPCRSSRLMGSYGHLLGARLRLNRSISLCRPVCKCRFGAFLSQGTRQFPPGNKEATGVAAEYRQVADAKPVWKPNANEIRATVGQLGLRAPHS